MTKKPTLRGPIALVLAMAVVLTACGDWFDIAVDDLNAAMEGRTGTIQSFDQAGRPMDSITGRSIRVSRESEFDSSATGSDGVSVNIPDSEVLRISIGDSIMRHVGSSLLIVEDCVTQVAGASDFVEIQSDEPGVPLLNSLFASFENRWAGKGQTIFIRSQDGVPIGVFAGDNVNVLSTDVPKSTRFQIDGCYLFAYRVDYATYENELLR